MQIVIETRLACRTKMPPVEETEFYEEVAKKGRKHWDQEKILPAKHKLMELYRDPANTMIGKEQVAAAGHMTAPRLALHHALTEFTIIAAGLVQLIQSHCGEATFILGPSRLKFKGVM